MQAGSHACARGQWRRSKKCAGRARALGCCSRCKSVPRDDRLSGCIQVATHRQTISRTMRMLRWCSAKMPMVREGLIRAAGAHGQADARGRSRLAFWCIQMRGGEAPAALLPVPGRKIGGLAKRAGLTSCRIYLSGQLVGGFHADTDFPGGGRALLDGVGGPNSAISPGNR